MPKTPLTSNSPLPSEAAKIKRTLDELNHDQWGFAIYRCTYGDDAAWDKFKDIADHYAREEIQESDTPEILDKFELKFFEDRETFDKASTGVLRAHFNEWVRENWQHEQPRARFSYVPRYEYFIRVDEESLQSVLADPKSRTARVSEINAG